MKGFTLIELLIVIGIIGILAGVTVVNLVGFTNDADNAVSLANESAYIRLHERYLASGSSEEEAGNLIRGKIVSTSGASILSLSSAKIFCPTTEKPANGNIIIDANGDCGTTNVNPNPTSTIECPSNPDNGTYSLVGGSCVLKCTPKPNNSSWDLPQEKIQASDAGAGDNFGRSVAIDDNIAIVGALGERTGGDRAGAAYIFEKGGNGRSTPAKKKATDEKAKNDYGEQKIVV